MVTIQDVSKTGAAIIMGICEHAAIYSHSYECFSVIHVSLYFFFWGGGGRVVEW